MPNSNPLDRLVYPFHKLIIDSYYLCSEIKATDQLRGYANMMFERNLASLLLRDLCM